MNKLCALLLLGLFISADMLWAATSDDASDEWKAGVSRAIITPEEPMWMAGYSSRDRPSEGKLHDLWAKALAIEDANGQQAILITADIRNFPKNISDAVRDRIEDQFGLGRDQIILNGSHTHTGPLLNTVRNYPYYIVSLDSDQKENVVNYSHWLEDRLVELTGEALESMKPARLYAENGVARFAVNRRNNPASTINRVTELAGPSDYAVPVLKVEDESGDLMAVAFGYACHPTVLSDYKWSGDYPGYAQLELEKEYPGTTFLFFQGAGGDQNPLPRRSIPLAEQYGLELAAAVERVLNEDMRHLSSSLSTEYSEVDVRLTAPPSREELEQMIEETSGNQQRWAEYYLEKIDQGETIMDSYPYPIQVWQLGDQMIFSLGGELVVDYAVQIKRIFGQDAFVMGYSNDVMAYIPTAGILQEGGYEGYSSHRVRNMPNNWNANIETVIMHEVVNLAEKVRESRAASIVDGNQD